MSQIRILLADDNQNMRTVYKRILETQDHIEIVGMAADGEEALEQAMGLMPDVAILDIVMPKINGIEVARRIIDHKPDTGVVIISSFAHPAYVSAIMKDGTKSRGFILKASLNDPSELIRVVEAVANGQIVLDPIIVQILFRLYSQESSSSLTKTEENVLQLMLEGRDTSFITQILGLRQEEMEDNAATGYAKLGVIAQNWGDRISSAVRALVIQWTEEERTMPESEVIELFHSTSEDNGVV